MNKKISVLFLSLLLVGCNSNNDAIESSSTTSSSVVESSSSITSESISSKAYEEDLSKPENKENSFTEYEHENSEYSDVENVVKDYIVTVKQTGEGGTINVDKQYANKGETINVYYDLLEGYQLVNRTIYLNGTPLEGTSFEMPNKNVTISASFAKIDYSNYVRYEAEKYIGNATSSNDNNPWVQTIGHVSAGKQIVWLNDEDEASLTVLFNAPASGYYYLEAVLSMANDYGNYDLYVNDSLAFESIDLYSSYYCVTSPYFLGYFYFDSNQEIKITLKAHARDAKSTNYYLGFDYLDLHYSND